MLAEFFIDPEAITKNGAHDEALLCSAFATFLECWRRYGVWVCPSDSAYLESLSRALSEAPQDLRTHFDRAASRLRRTEVPFDLLPTLPVRAAQLRDAFKAPLVGVSAQATKSLGFDATEFSRIFASEGVEICRFEALAASATFRAMRELSETPAEPGMSREAIWTERFSLLANLTTTFMIADKYALIRLSRVLKELKDSGIATPENLIKDNGLCYVLSKIVATAKDQNVIIYTKSLSQAKTEECKNALNGIVNYAGRSNGVLELRMNDDYPEHDRFMRFDDDCVVTLGSGIELLDCATVGPKGADDKTHDCNLKPVTSIFREIEAKLNRLCLNRRGFS